MTPLGHCTDQDDPPELTRGRGENLSERLPSCFSSAGSGALVKRDGIMNSSEYQDILAQNLLASVRKLKMKRNLTLQHDNDPKHTSKSSRHGFRKGKIKVLGWPSQSPDPNPIKNMWNDLKRAVDWRSPPRTFFCKEELDKISKSRCAKLIETYSQRLAALINAKSASTNYYYYLAVMCRLMQSGCLFIFYVLYN